ncbi:MAG: class I SAM-dependent methyltransferase [Bacteroidales bacterium]
MQHFWDERFDTKEYVYGRSPNEFFKEFIDTLNPGSVLLPADGEGRNSVYAALKGWEVTAFDFSSKAKEKAEKLAQEYNVKINYTISSIEDFSTKEKFDLIAIIFLHLPSNTRKQVHTKLIEYLKPGGYFLIEAFSKNQINQDTGGPRNEDMLYSGQDLLDDLTGLEIIHYKEITKERYEGYFHKGKAEIIQLIGQKLN